MIQRFITNDAMQVGDRLPDPKAKEKSKYKAKEEVAGEAEDKSKVGGTNNIQRFITDNDWASYDSARGGGVSASAEAPHPSSIKASSKASKYTAIADSTGKEMDHLKAAAVHRQAAGKHDELYKKTGNSNYAVTAHGHRDKAKEHLLAAKASNLAIKPSPSLASRFVSGIGHAVGAGVGLYGAHKAFQHASQYQPLKNEEKLREIVNEFESSN